MSDIISNQTQKNQIPYQERPETERNRKIVEMYLSGRYSYNSLSRIFKISPQRISHIIKKATKEGGEKNEPSI